MILIGKEKVQWWSQHKTKPNKAARDNIEKKEEIIKIKKGKSYKRHYANHICLNYKFALKRFPNKIIPKGQYQFPFSFYLPENIPSTFFYKWEDFCKSSYAQVSYHVKVVIKNKQKDLKLKSKQEFVVNLNKDLYFSNTKKIEKYKQIKTCCVYDKGNVKLSGSFEKDSYYPDQNAKCLLEVENNSEVGLCKIEAAFVQMIGIRTGTRVFYRNDILNVISVEKEINPKEKRLAADNRALILKFKLEGLESPQNKETQSFTHYNTNTYGSLVECQYYLDIEIKYDGCHCFERDPSLRVPLLVQNPQINPSKIDLQKLLQMDWNPDVFKTYVAMLVPGFEKKISNSFHGISVDRETDNYTYSK